MSAPDYLQGELIERLAHDVRGPVGVTSGALDEIELASSGEDSEKLRAYFLMARRGMRRVLRVMERLERRAQLASGRVQWAMVPTDLRAVAEHAVHETELLEARREVRVTVSCSEEPCSVAIDRPWMHLAITELVGNAIRFGRSAVTVRCEASADEVTITIADDGRGFKAAPSDRGGVGLSLPLVHDVVVSHGGRLDLDGQRAGETDGLSGARVVVTLPRVGATP